MKEKTMANTEQYRAVLDDLMKQRSLLQFKIGEIDSAVAALSRLMPIEQPTVSSPREVQLPMNISGGKYGDMSVRWAILNFLSEDAVRPMMTSEIAAALVTGGVTTRGKSFASNVSAVLSDMSKDREEVQATSDGWTITPKGKEAWIHAKAARERKANLDQARSLETSTVQ